MSNAGTHDDAGPARVTRRSPERRDRRGEDAFVEPVGQQQLIDGRRRGSQAAAAIAAS